jgi:hypothetical protein
MDWIKKNPAQFSLAVVSVGLLASAYFLFSNYSGFSDSFAASRSNPPENKDVPVLDTASVDASAKSVASPAVWTPKKGRLFAGKLYVSKEGQLKRPDVGGEPFNPPISNEWLLKYDLDLLNPAVISEDTDKDGFNTLLEWNGMDGQSHMTSTVPPQGPYEPVKGPDGKDLPADQTDPQKADSHPPYYTRLSLAQVVNIPFRLRFMTYDINPKNPKDITVSINTVDLGGRTQFLEMGTDIRGTKFKIESFEKKEAPGEDGTKKDVSELTILNKESGEKLMLPIGKIVDSPESYVVIKYLWFPFGGQESAPMNKQKGQTFTIPPENDKLYKVIDIRPDEVDIQLPSGQKLTLRKGK